MKKIATLFLFVVLTTSLLHAQFYVNGQPVYTTKKVAVTCDQQDAKIYVNGNYVSTGSTQLKITSGQSVNVRCEKTGYVTLEKNYINNGSSTIPKTDYLQMQVDEAFNSSVQTDIANREIEIRTTKSADEAWTLINQIIQNYYDVIETSDQKTGYLRTAWNQKAFPSSTIRTRIIIKMGNSNPLSYKIKMASERAVAGTSIKDDEKFKEWDRVLRTYEPLIPEIQSRLGTK